jgi:hypothetical protein
LGHWGSSLVVNDANGNQAAVYFHFKELHFVGRKDASTPYERRVLRALGDAGFPLSRALARTYQRLDCA